MPEALPRPSGSGPSGIRSAWALPCYLGYAAFFIYRTSFVVAGERYFSLFDDAMISMRYARNLVRGYGLVWNQGGPRVEGFTNPLWVIVMAGVHLLPLPPSKASLAVQVTAALLLCANLYYVRGLALTISDGSPAVGWGAVVLTAAYLPINNWGLQGMEVCALVPLLTVCALVAIRSLESGRFTGRLYMLLGAGTLIRPDMAVTFAAFLGFLAAADRANRRRHLQWGLTVLAASVVAQTGLRLWYYGDPLPNTFYLKMTGFPLLPRLSRGVYVLLQFVWKANALLMALPLLLMARRDRRVWFLGWIVLVQMAYSVYVGGDAWEYWGGSNRYIAIVMPAFFVLLAEALYGLPFAVAAMMRGSEPWSGARSAFAVRATPTVVYALLVGFAVVSVNSIHGAAALAEALLITPPLHTGPGGENHHEVETALALQRITTPRATLAVVRAGTIPYFTDRPIVDELGKNDRALAREPARVFSRSTLGRLVEFRPGHMKFDYALSIGGEQPDVVAQLWSREAEAKPFLDAAYQPALVNGRCIYARRGSPNVIWHLLPPGGCGR